MDACSVQIVERFHNCLAHGRVRENAVTDNFCSHFELRCHGEYLKHIRCVSPDNRSSENYVVFIRDHFDKTGDFAACLCFAETFEIECACMIRNPFFELFTVLYLFFLFYSNFALE